MSRQLYGRRGPGNSSYSYEMDITSSSASPHHDDVDDDDFINDDDFFWKRTFDSGLVRILCHSKLHWLEILCRVPVLNSFT